MRPRNIALGATGAVVFVLISLVLARALGVPGVERDAVIDSVKRQAVQLDKPGRVQILNIKPDTTFAVRGTTRTARVAWKAGTALPIVQCVTLKRSGDVIGGFDVRVLRVSKPIPRDRDC